MNVEKTNEEMYSELMHFINYCYSVDKLKDMLIEAIDNSNADCYTELYQNYRKEIEQSQF
jgi:hypothetical protein